MGGISIPALLRSNCVRITAVDLQQGAGWIFPVIRGARTDATTEERMIQIQLRPEVEAQLAAEAQARGLALDHYIEMIVKARSVEQIRQQSVAEAIDRIRELRKGNRLSGFKIKDLIHEGHKY
jgi:hypothetical protein